MTTEAAPCQHHWLIEQDIVMNAPGECKKCGATRTFQGVTDENPYEMQRRRKGVNLYGRQDPDTYESSGWSVEYE
jgi:hypothetical protein